MFRHQGSHRKFRHNLKSATLLAFVAGLVNVVGFLSVRTMTTSVTGHFALFIEEAFGRKLSLALMYIGFVLCFLAGSFMAALLVEYSFRKHGRQLFVIPVFIEAILLLQLGFLPQGFVQQHPILIANLLLLGMGMQNSLITHISNAVVRTTHLTGLFTDLGIELAQLFFYRKREEQVKLRLSVFLRLSIIGAFFAGGILSGFLYTQWQIHTLILGGLLLLYGLFYDQWSLRKIIQTKANSK